MVFDGDGFRISERIQSRSMVRSTRFTLLKSVRMHSLSGSVKTGALREVPRNEAEGFAELERYFVTREHCPLWRYFLNSLLIAAVQ